MFTAAILGAMSSVGTAAPLLTVGVNTTEVGGQYTPSNCVAIWAETEAGGFVKTLGRWCDIRKVHLVAWQAKAGLGDVDAVSGATRATHAERLTVTWDLKNRLGVPVLDGTYRVRIETADESATTQGQNWQGSFTFTKGLAPEITMPLDPLNHYLNVSIKYDPTALECNNSVVDPGETCDPPGSCPSVCEPSGDSCAPNVVVGTAASCTAACMIVPVSSCIHDDGCCTEGCGPLMDNDCSDQDIGGGCSTRSTSSAPLAFALLGAVLLFGRRRRRR